MELWNARVRESQIYGMLELRGCTTVGSLRVLRSWNCSIVESKNCGIPGLWESWNDGSRRILESWWIVMSENCGIQKLWDPWIRGFWTSGVLELQDLRTVGSQNYGIQGFLWILEWWSSRIAESLCMYWLNWEQTGECSLLEPALL